MNKKTLILGITILFLITLLSGCNEEKSTLKLVTAQLDTLSLKLDDLPEEYQIWNKGSEFLGDRIQGIMPEEFYYIAFAHASSLNNTNSSLSQNQTYNPSISVFLYKFNSSDEATIVLHNLSNEIKSSFTFYNRTTPDNIEEIGDESIYELYQQYFTGQNYTDFGVNSSFSYIYFRILNVDVFILLQGITHLQIDYVDLTINYSKIIESRINASLK